MGGQGALLTVGGVLAAVIAWEIVDIPRGNVAPARPYDLAAKQDAPPARADDVQAWVRPILARPLFSPDRRPAAGLDSVTAAGARGLPRLTGILVGPFGRSAIFASNGNTPIVLGEGGRIGAYTIKSIGAAEVRLDGPHGVQRLRPAFDTAEQAVPTPPGPTRRVRQVAGSK